jgi:hypothetical protein
MPKKIDMNRQMQSQLKSVGIKLYLHLTFEKESLNTSSTRQRGCFLGLGLKLDKGKVTRQKNLDFFLNKTVMLPVRPLGVCELQSEPTTCVLRKLFDYSKTLIYLNDFDDLGHH